MHADRRSGGKLPNALHLRCSVPTARLVRSFHNKKRYKIMTIAKIALLSLTVGLGQVTQALADQNSYQPSEDFDVFWSQVRTAFLENDPRMLAAAQKAVDESIGKVSSDDRVIFKWDYVELNEECDASAATAYLDGILEQRDGWRDFLNTHETLDYRGSEDVARDGSGAYIIKDILRVRFNDSYGHWQITELMDDRAEMFRVSAAAGGPSGC